MTSVEFLGMKKWVRFVRMAFPWVCFYFLRVQSPLRWKMDKAQQLSWGFLPSHQNSRKLSRKWVYLTWTYILAFFFFETYIFSWCYLKKKKKSPVKITYGMTVLCVDSHLQNCAQELSWFGVYRCFLFFGEHNMEFPFGVGGVLFLQKKKIKIISNHNNLRTYCNSETICNCHKVTVKSRLHHKKKVSDVLQLVFYSVHTPHYKVCFPLCTFPCKETQ